jgi:sarcosine oxidase
MVTSKTFDVAIIGSGTFGAWTALQLKRAGAEVILLDAYGPANPRASSGGESRMIRMGYGPDEIYTRMAQRSLVLWRELFNQSAAPSLFQPTGILWLAGESDLYCEATLKTLQRCEVKYERLERAELNQRYPHLELDASAWGILEPDSGVLMARQAVPAVVAAARKAGVIYIEEAIIPPPVQLAGLPGKESTDLGGIDEEGAKMTSLETLTGRKIFAKQFVFACGPWLPKIFPTLLGGLIYVTRQEVFFFAVPSGSKLDGFGPERMPAWIDFNDLVYGIPNLEDRGFKVAIDAHGPEFDPDTGDRTASSEGLAAVRAYLAQRMPSLANEPVINTSVCQYENTSNGDFLVDCHPAFDNVWLVGGGSGHGFKHGPAVGEHVASLISGEAKVEARFALATKEQVQQRKVF